MSGLLTARSWSDEGFIIRRAIAPMINMITAAQAAQPNNNPINLPVGNGVGSGVEVSVGSDKAAIKNKEISIYKKVTLNSTFIKCKIKKNFYIKNEYK